MKIIPRNKVISHFEANMQAVEKIAPGEIIKFEARDAYDGQIDSEDKFRNQIDESRVTLATGPVFVEGAEKGDLIQVKILDIALSDKGVGVTNPGWGLLGDMIKKPTTIVFTKVENKFFSFRGINIPARPHIGVIGVAPLEGKISSNLPGRHGGNIDTTDITEGSTLYLPVSQKGGLLALGDCHAMMGDGEIAAGGEISAEVIVKVDVIKSKKIEWPLVETKDYTMVIVSADNAAKEASKQAVDLLSKGLDLSWDEAVIFVSLTVDLKISQICNTPVTIRAAIPKSIISTQKLIEAI